MNSSTLFIATIIIVALLVLVLVIYLVLIIIALRRAGTHLKGLAGGLQKIQDDTGPLEEKVDVITVPVAAVLQDGQGNDVVRVVLVDGTTTQVQIKTGLSEGAFVEVTEGLNGDELVLVET